MSAPTIDDEKRRARGKEIYETQIKQLVEPQEKGKFVVIDVATGDYAMGRDLGFVTEELRKRRPDAVTHTVRVGHKAVFNLRSPRKITMITGPLPTAASG